MSLLRKPELYLEVTKRPYRKKCHGLDFPLSFHNYTTDFLRLKILGSTNSRFLLKISKFSGISILRFFFNRLSGCFRRAILILNPTLISFCKRKIEFLILVFFDCLFIFYFVFLFPLSWPSLSEEALLVKKVEIRLQIAVLLFSTTVY